LESLNIDQNDASRIVSIEDVESKRIHLERIKISDELFSQSGLGTAESFLDRYDELKNENGQIFPSDLEKLKAEFGYIEPGKENNDDGGWELAPIHEEIIIPQDATILPFKPKKPDAEIIQFPKKTESTTNTGSRKDKKPKIIRHNFRQKSSNDRRSR